MLHITASAAQRLRVDLLGRDIWGPYTTLLFRFALKAALHYHDIEGCIVFQRYGAFTFVDLSFRTGFGLESKSRGPGCNWDSNLNILTNMGMC